MEIWPGKPYPLGATFDGTGTNFGLFSEIAEGVELCLIGERGGETRIPMPEVDGYVWHCYLPTVQPGQRYGYRVHGPYDQAGARLVKVPNDDTFVYVRHGANSWNFEPGRHLGSQHWSPVQRTVMAPDDLAVYARFAAQRHPGSAAKQFRQ